MRIYPFLRLLPSRPTRRKSKNGLVRRRAEDGETANERWTVLLVRSPVVAVRVELGRRGEEGSTEPDGVPLLLVRDDVDVDTGRLRSAKRERRRKYRFEGGEAGRKEMGEMTRRRSRSGKEGGGEDEK